MHAVRRAQRPVDQSEGLYTAAQVAGAFGVSIHTVYLWGRAYQGTYRGPELAAFQTPAGSWRFSVAAVRAQLERMAV